MISTYRPKIPKEPGTVNHARTSGTLKQRKSLKEKLHFSTNKVTRTVSQRVGGVSLKSCINMGGQGLGNGFLIQNSECLKRKDSRVVLFTGENLEPSVNKLSLPPHKKAPEPHCLLLNRHLAKARREKGYCEIWDSFVHRKKFFEYPLYVSERWLLYYVLSTCWIKWAGLWIMTLTT